MVTQSSCVNEPGTSQSVRLLHLTDLHLAVSPTAEVGGIQPSLRWKMLAGVLAAEKLEFDVIVISGDLASCGHTGSYAMLKELLCRHAPGGVPVMLGLGNHDRRERFKHVFEDSKQTQASRCYSSMMLNGLQVIMLDTSLPGSIEGDLDRAQLDWLENTLGIPAPLGHLLVMHHPPRSPDGPFLMNSHDLERVLEDSNVRAILAGHIHKPWRSTFARIPLICSPSLAYGIDLVNNRREILDEFGFTQLQIDRDGIGFRTYLLQPQGTASRGIPIAA